ncbi:MAG TPA: SIR2 family protein [Deltaproteobacteria bacterium]|nr:SIR2 family protein [Deltaproteobacteria bacterium]HQJ08632.1 SIR2 family protein [Deltaproteobacteria bacterium]
MAIEDMIVLGAGASASEGAPVQKDLFAEFFRTDSGYPRNPASIERLHRFFKQFFGVDIKGPVDGIIFPSFEEVLGILEIAIDRGESFKGYSAMIRSPDVQTIREDLIFLIALVLNRTLMEPKGYHRALVKRLTDEGRIRSTAFLSLNYDILIDNALTELHPEYDLDYRVEFTNYGRGHNWMRPRKERAIELYKLHGSLNWLYCPTCISLTLTPREREVARLVEEPVTCLDCGMSTVPIITPPTYLQGMENYFLLQIMRRAESALRHVKRIIFCGYSFPDADLLVRYMFKRVEMNFDPRPEIYVVNEYEGKKNEYRHIEELRYRRFFRDKDCVYYLNRTFRDFCRYGLGPGH